MPIVYERSTSGEHGYVAECDTCKRTHDVRTPNVRHLIHHAEGNGWLFLRPAIIAADHTDWSVRCPVCPAPQTPPQTKLTRDTTIAIYRAHQAGDDTNALALRYRVTLHTIMLIVNNPKWFDLHETENESIPDSHASD